MELDGRFRKKGGFDTVYKYLFPIKCHGGLLPTLKTMSQRVRVGAPCGCRWVVHEMLPYLPYYGNDTQHLSSLPRIRDHYVIRSWYWTIQRINDLVVVSRFISKMGRFVKWNGGVSVDGRTQDPQWKGAELPLLLQPEEAGEKATEESLARAENLRTLARNQKKKQNKGGE